MRAALGKPTRGDEDKGQQQQGTLPARGQKGKRREIYGRRCEREMSRAALWDKHPDLTACPRPQSVNCQSLPLAGLDRKLRASKHADETPESDSARSKAGEEREERIPLSKWKKPSLRPEPKFQFFHLPAVWFWTTNTQLPCAAVSLPIKNMK